MDTKLLKQKILDLAIRGKLVPQDPNDEPASVLLEKIRREKQELIKQGKIKKDKNESTIFVGDDKLHYEKFADGTVKNIEEEIPFSIPDTWSWCRLKDLGKIVAGGTPDTSKKTYWNGSVNWLTPADLSGYKEKYILSGERKISEDGLKHSSAQLISPQSVLFSSRAPIGYCVINLDYISTNQGFKSIDNINKKMTEYIYYYLKFVTPIITENASGTTFKEISGTKFGQTLFLLPPLAEQQRIVSKIEELFAQVDKIEEERQSLLKLIDKAKDKVLDLAMKGKLVKQDPNDEPASVLLEKIFEEKKKLAKEGKIKLSKDELLEPKPCVDNDYYEKLGYNTSINWLKCEIRDVLYYEQPTKYIVEDTNYNDKYETPVLTAGKSFILGYTNEKIGIFDDVPCIIFDDFTTESKYVNFPSKVKSSAMKILKSNSNINLLYAFYIMQQLVVNINTHKRYWISDYSKKEIIIPSLKMQNKILNCIEDFIEYFNKIKAELN